MTSGVPEPATETSPGPLIGWREWVSLPDLGLVRTKAKVDTGARSSAIHATGVHLVAIDGHPHVRFTLHPWQGSEADPVEALAPLVDERSVRSSNGQIERRPVIRTLVAIGHHQWPIDLTLTDRDGMGFRMLLGREALRRRVRIDPGQSYLAGTPGLDVLRRNRRRHPSELPT